MSAALHPYAAVMVAKAALSTIHEALCMNHIEKTGSFTCQEAEATHAAYLALGLDEMAEQFMAAHAYADSLIEGDIHVHIEGGGIGGDKWRYATAEELAEYEDEPEGGDVACDRCGSVYDEARGDGYCGMCPSCADKTEPRDPDEEDDDGSVHDQG